MARRKMSEAQREKIRRDIKKGLKKGQETSEILNAVARKYKISPETGRWYLKTITGEKPAPGSRNGGKRISLRGASGKLLDVVSSVSESRLKRALKAKRLIPAWESHLKKAESLRKLESRVKRDLRQAVRKAESLERKIRTLTAG